MFEIKDLRCEYASTPLGVDTPYPRLSWTLCSNERAQHQSAYQLRAASSLAKLTSGEIDLWDSGKVESASQMVTYAGHTLGSGTCVWWQVQVWDKTGQTCAPSQPTLFEIGLLHIEDWSAEWTGFPAGWNGQALYFRKAFQIVRAVQRARLYVCGLGYYELHLNGKKVGDSVLTPGWSTYAKRVIYNVYDIDHDIIVGENVVGVIIGNGWYGAPSLLLQLRVVYEDGSSAVVCASGSGWQVTHGPIVANSIFDGETYDARLEMPGWDTPAYTFSGLEKWTGSMIVDGPGGKLVSETAPPIRITQTLPPTELSQPKPQVYVFDMGQNFAGWVRLRVSGNRGTKITLRFAESLYPDGTVNQENLRSAAATDVYILKGEGVEQWEPRFTYHGFRYVQVEGFPGKPTLDTIEGCVIRSDNVPTGTFTCSSDLLNAIHHMVRWTEISNEPSVPTDCPQRDERMGWLNDMAARSEQIVYNFDVARFLAKWVADIEDTQDPITGAITDTAPYRWGHRPADPVSVCYLLIPWLLYLHYGDIRTMTEHYAGMKAWVDFLHRQADNDIVAYSYWGDWSPPIAEGVQDSIGSSAVSRNTPGALISTGMNYYATHLLSDIARVVGHAQDATVYGAHADRIAKAYHRRFFNPDTGGYGSNNQACNAFSLYLGLVPPSYQAHVVENLVHDVVVKHAGHLTTGNICTKYLLEVLSAANRADIAYLLASQETYPSWGYMLANGATTVWERWESATGGGMNSHNHPMLGSLGSWFYRAITGIQVDPAGPGFKCMHIKPHFIADLQYAKAVLKTVQGEVESSWERHEDVVELMVKVPVGSTARVSLPKGDQPCSITESGKIVWGAGAMDVTGINTIEDDGYAVTFTVSSGTYTFTRIPNL